MQIHAYHMSQKTNGLYSLQLCSRLSTDSKGIAACLGLQADANVELEQIVQQLETKVSSQTLFTLGSRLVETPRGGAYQ